MTLFTTAVTPGRSVRRSADARAPIAPHTEARAFGRVVAQATTQLLPDATGGTLHIHIDCAGGHQPPRARRLLVQDLVTRAEHAHIERVLIVIPLGDSEILNVLRERCSSVRTRPAGTSCIVEADVQALSRRDPAG